jgi:DNA polymerase III gamma/tau subunit
MPLHTDCRPDSFDQFFGNESTVKSLRSVLARENKPHVFLMQGPRGCGKTTLARLIAKDVGATESEIREFNTANTRGIDTVRDIIRSSQYEPLSGAVTFYILDEAHQITPQAQEALNKFLEDTPNHVYIAFCTTNPERIIATVKDRCSIFNVKPLLRNESMALIKWVLEGESKTLSGNVIKTILTVSEGYPRRTLVLLEQIIDLDDEKDQIEAIQSTTFDETEIIDICRKLIERGQGEQKWIELSAMLKTSSQDPEGTRRAILGYMSKVLLSAKGADSKRVASLMAEFYEPYYNTGNAGLVLSCYMACMV